MSDKSTPLLREWELNSDSSRYDQNLAAPSDDELQTYWSVWAGVALFAGIFVVVVFLGVVTSRTTRKHPFNMYLIYLMIPDFMFSLLCGISCLLNAVQGSYWSHWMCNFQQWYCVFGIGANCWLNAVVSHQIHKLLSSSHQRRRYTMPSRRTVTMQAILVYLYSAFLGTWGLINKDNFPFHAIQVRGLACIPIEADVQSSIFFWVAFLPLFSGIPIVYVVYVGYDIWKRGLLPKSGKTRLISVYFGRIVVVFLAMWGPYFILNYVLVTWLPTWVVFAGGTFSHLQGPTSAAVCLMKPDIRCAVVRFLRCQCWSRAQDEEMPQQKSAFGTGGAGDAGSLATNRTRSTSLSSSHRANSTNDPVVIKSSSQPDRTMPRRDSNPTQTTDHSETQSDQDSVLLWPADDGEFFSTANNDAREGAASEAGDEETPGPRGAPEGEEEEIVAHTATLGVEEGDRRQGGIVDCERPERTAEGAYRTERDSGLVSVGDDSDKSHPRETF